MTDTIPEPTTGRPRERRWPRRPPIAVVVLAAIAYLPALRAAPGRMPTDTKLFLYLDPGRLVADAPFTWDTRQFAGWVPHQTIAYLWPSGPWFWTFDTIGVPDWIAHRLWLGTLLFLAGLGVRWAARHLGLDARSAAVAGAVYALSPYILPYVSRTSVMLLPYMGLGWLIGLTVRATARSRWRDVGWFGLVVLTIGAVNATALALVAPAPVLWLVHAAWQRSISWRTAIVTALKLGAISLLVSMWWIVMLVVQGRHGADVLAFSETLEAVSLTSVSTETLRGLGYWLFYVRDPYAFTTTAAIDHLGSVWIIAAGYALVVLALAGLALVRWSQRRFVAWMFVAGVVLAVGVHPIDDPSPLMAPLEESALGLALRSSTRALPLSAFAVALGAATLVTLAARVRVRGRELGVVAAVGLVLLAVVGLPASTSGGYVDPALVRDQDVPDAWLQAVADLDAGSTEYRVLQLPGSEFGAFRWGYTVDPPLPGLTDKPLVTRDLLPLGSPGAMDLLYALDNRFQAGTVDPDAIAPIARLLGVDTIWVANDLAFDRFRTPRPELVSALFGDQPAGLGTPRGFGTPTVNVNDIPMIDEQGITDARLGVPIAPIELVDVEDPLPIVRVLQDVVVVAGSGDGLVDAAAAGLITGDEAVVYVADLGRWSAAGVPDEAIPADALVVITDSNRDRATHWRGSQDTTGLTEVGGGEPDALREDVADQRLDVFGTDGTDGTVDPAQQTVAVLDGGLVVRATGYGEPFAYRPEDRPAMAVDGDPDTAWRVADRFDPRGEQLQVSATDGQLRLVQQQRPDANRWITAVRITAGDATPVDVALDERSRSLDGQVVDVEPGVMVTIEIVDIAPLAGGTDSGASAVGFAEIGPVARETVRVPLAADPLVDADRPVAIVLTRLRVRPTDRWRSDPELALDRTFRLPVARTIDDVVITLRRNDRAADPLVDALASASGTALPGAVSNRRLTGVPDAHAAAAFDGVDASAWITPFGQAVGSTITVTTDTATTGPLTLVQPIGTAISPITQLTLTPAGGEPMVLDVVTGADGTAALDLPAPLPAGELTIGIGAVDPRTTVDRRWAEPVQLPAAIAELTGLEVVAAPVADLAPCRTDLLQLDGRPVGVSVDATQLAALAAGEAVDVGLCDAGDGTSADLLDTLDAGEHRLVAAAGLDTGIDVDRIVVRSGLTPSEPSEPSTASAPAVERSRTERTIVVEPCPDGCFVVLGEGYNAAWSATVDGRSIGAPVQIGGGFNGWWLPPSDTARTVTATWTPQRSLMIALALSVLGVLASVGLVVADRRRLDTGLPTSPPDIRRRSVWMEIGDREARRSVLLAAGVLVIAAVVVVEPRWGAAALVPAAAVVATGRTRLLALAGAAGVALLGALVAWREYDQRFLLDASWPGHFEDLHRAGLFVVVLVLAGTLSPDREAPAGPPGNRPPDPDPTAG